MLTRGAAGIGLGVLAGVVCLAGVVFLFSPRPDCRAGLHPREGAGIANRDGAVSGGKEASSIPVKSGDEKGEDGKVAGQPGTNVLVPGSSAETGNPCDDIEAEDQIGKGPTAPEEIAALKEKFMRERFGAICRHDKWIPTVSGGTNLVYITTGSLPPGRVGEAYEAQLQAASGFPPYSWCVAGGELPEGLTLDALSGKLRGIPLAPATADIFVGATDSRGSRDVAEYVLMFQPEDPLVILTGSMPAACPGEDYFFQLQASGGIPPYAWSVAGGLDQLGTIVLDPQTGQISGSIAASSLDSDIPLVLTLCDAQLQVSKEFVFRIRSALSILNYPQASVYEEDEFEFAFQAAGGTGPYVWGVSNSLPPGLELSAAGVCSGKPAESGRYEVSVWVQDNEGQASSVQFTLEVLPKPAASISAFEALLSRNSVALKWGMSTAGDNLSVRIVRCSAGHPAAPSDGTTLYLGPATAYTDSDVGRGTYYYAAFLEENGITVTSMPPPRVCVTLPPETDPFADGVTGKNLLHPNAFRSSELPQIVLGAPRGTGLGSGSLDIVSIGAAINNDGGASAPYGGFIMVEFTDNVAWDGPGVDFTVFENVFYVCNEAGVFDPETRFMEPATVSVSQDGINWRQFPIDFSPRYDPDSGELNLRHPYCYNSGFAGVNPVMSNGNDPDPTDPAMSGGDSFDISVLGLEWIRYVLIQSTGSRWLADRDGGIVYHNEETGAASRSNNKAGFDLDAVAAIWMKKISASGEAGGGGQ